MKYIAKKSVREGEKNKRKKNKAVSNLSKYRNMYNEISELHRILLVRILDKRTNGFVADIVGGVSCKCILVAILSVSRG